MSVSNKQRGEDKVSRIPIKIIPTEIALRKPEWIRIKVTNSHKVTELKKTIKDNGLFTVCEEASCPNLNECYANGTATFMILGDLCTRRCPFCDVAHGRPLAPDVNEPDQLAKTIQLMQLKYVVITSVDRDDLKDGGASHFQECIKQVRVLNPTIEIEVLVPDFRGRMEKALSALQLELPDVFNHNLETVERLYHAVRPQADYKRSLELVQWFKNKGLRTKSGIMVGIGERTEEVIEIMKDLRDHGCDIMTIGQYLQPTKDHLPVDRFVNPEEFSMYQKEGMKMGFMVVESGPLVRSSYHADKHADI